MSLVSKLGKYLDKNKFQIASMALMAYTGYAAFGGTAFGAGGMTAAQSAALGSTTAASGMLAQGEITDQTNERDRKREEEKYDRDTVYFGLDRNATEADVTRRKREMTLNAMPQGKGGARSYDSRSMATAMPQSPQNIDDLINLQHA